MRYLIGIMMVLMAVPVWAAEPRFFDDLGDVPVMPDLVELTDRAVVFDKPAGRIAQATALAAPAASAGAVQAFYAESLPQFGWQGMGEGVFTREDQKLTISRTREGGRDLVVFRLEPR